MYPQWQWMRLETLHSLWRTKTDIWKRSNILLKNISATQNVCTANRYLSSVHNLLVSTVAVNEAGDTPLSLECSRGNLEMVKALINKHVDPKSKCSSWSMISAVKLWWWFFTEPVNKAGDTPLSLAYKGGHWEVVKYLAITHHCDTTSNSHLISGSQGKTRPEMQPPCYSVYTVQFWLPQTSNNFVRLDVKFKVWFGRWTMK